MGELIVPVLFMVLGIVFYRDAAALPEYDDGLPMTSATYPQVLAVLVMICSLYLIVRFFVRRKKFTETEKRMIFDPRVLLAFALLAAFYFLLPVIGYIPCAFLFLAALSLFFQKGRPRLLDTLVMPAALSVGMYYGFRMLSIYLPPGSLFKDFF